MIIYGTTILRYISRNNDSKGIWPSLNCLKSITFCENNFFLISQPNIIYWNAQIVFVIVMENMRFGMLRECYQLCLSTNEYWRWKIVIKQFSYSWFHACNNEEIVNEIFLQCKKKSTMICMPCSSEALWARKNISIKIKLPMKFYERLFEFQW